MLRPAGIATLLGLLLRASAAIAAADEPAAPAPMKLPESPIGKDYERPPSDPAAVERGKQVFSVNCGFCHGSGARGGEGGPNLLRSSIVLNDQKGEAIAVVVQNGRPDKGMPKFDLDNDVVADVAAYLHTLAAATKVQSQIDPKAILVGNPAAGKKYFFGKGNCSRCHSLGGDLAHIGSRYSVKTLQDNIVSGAAVTMLGAPLPSAPPRTVSVRLASGDVVAGRLESIDDFNVTLTDAAGYRHSIRRQGDSPHVTVTNPMQAHVDMLRAWEDRDIHDLTAFLAQQK